MWCIVYGMKVLKRHTHTHTAMCIFGLFTIFAVFPAHIHKVQKCLSIFNKSLHVYDVNQRTLWAKDAKLKFTKKTCYKPITMHARQVNNFSIDFGLRR